MSHKLDLLKSGVIVLPGKPIRTCIIWRKLHNSSNASTLRYIVGCIQFVAVILVNYLLGVWFTVVVGGCDRKNNLVFVFPSSALHLINVKYSAAHLFTLLHHYIHGLATTTASAAADDDDQRFTFLVDFKTATKEAVSVVMETLEQLQVHWCYKRHFFNFRSLGVCVWRSERLQRVFMKKSVIF